MNKGQKPYLLHSSPYQETQNDFYFSLILRFCNFYSIKMINKSIKLETKTIIESVSSGTPRPIISRGCACVFAPTQRGWDSVLLTGHTLFSEGNKLPFPGSRKALKAWATFKPGWWESSRQGPGSSLDKHSQGTCFRYPCQTALPHLLRGIKNPQMSPQSFILYTIYFIEETTVSCAAETWQFGLHIDDNHWYKLLLPKTQKHISQLIICTAVTTAHTICQNANMSSDDLFLRQGFFGRVTTKLASSMQPAFQFARESSEPLKVTTMCRKTLSNTDSGKILLRLSMEAN